MLIGQYVVLAVGRPTALFGLGLAFYATPSTDAALSNLPADQAGIGRGHLQDGVSSLGSAIGAAISLAVFTAVAGSSGLVHGLPSFTMQGRTRQHRAASGRDVRCWASTWCSCILAILSIVMTVPKGGGSRDLGRSAPSPDPPAQLPPDEAREALIARLSTLSLAELEDLERQVLRREVVHLEPAVLEQIVQEHRD